MLTSIPPLLTSGVGREHMMIREATIDDLPALLRLRARLWPYCVAEENEKEMIQILRSPRHGAMLALREDDGTPCGYLELSMRDYVDGCKSSPVGYIEGIYIEVADRGKGIGRKMIEEGLSRRHGDTEVKDHEMGTGRYQDFKPLRLGGSVRERMTGPLAGAISSFFAAWSWGRQLPTPGLPLRGRARYGSSPCVSHRGVFAEVT